MNLVIHSKKKILWIEDDYYAIAGLLYLLVQEGYEIIPAYSAVDGYNKAKEWHKYDMIIVDMILAFTSDEGQIPSEIEDLRQAEFLGPGLIRVMREKLSVNCPLLILSVIPNPIEEFGLEDMNVSGVLLKRALSPEKVKDTVMKILQ